MRKRSANFGKSQDLRFIDPAFTCEVVLTGPARALYESGKPQFERLKGVRSLGLIAQIQDVAQHTRHQHLVGLMRIFNKLCQMPAKKGLPKNFLWSFWCRLCFAQVGHAALSYDSEKAVLLACHIDTAFKDKLRELLEPVITSMAACKACTRAGCEMQTKGSKEAPVWFEELLAKNRWQQLHLWIAALKLINNSPLCAILNQQSRIKDKDNHIGFSLSEALKLMVAPNCKWDPVVRNLSRLDYIPRDLAFAGTIGIRFDVDSLVSAADEKHPDWRLLGSLSSYMSENIYESPELQLSSTLFQRALAALLIKGKVTLDELFGLNPSAALSDDELRSRVARTAAGKQIFDDAIRHDWAVWPIDTFLDPQLVPCDAEKIITGHAAGHLTRHVYAKVTCVKFSKNHQLALAMRHRNREEKPAATAFVKLCRSVLLKQLPRIDTEALADALYEGLVAKECEHGLASVVGRLASLELEALVLQKPASVINKRVSSRPTAENGLTFQIGDFAYNMPSDQHEFIVNAMHAAVSGGEIVQKHLGMSLESAAGVLWSELLRWQSLHFNQKTPRAFLDLLDAAQNALAARVVAGKATASADLEAYTLLEALKHPAKAVSFRIALPNLKLFKDDGQQENEYDVVSVILKEDKHVEVWVWGVTTEKDLSKKRNEDLAKIERLKDTLESRWGGDVRCVTCYVHRDGREICLDIAGKRERRPIAP
jgi:hypothetical protein